MEAMWSRQRMKGGREIERVGGGGESGGRKVKWVEGGSRGWRRREAAVLVNN